MKLTAKYKGIDIKTGGDQVSTMDFPAVHLPVKRWAGLCIFPAEYTDTNFISCFMKNYLHLFL